MVSALVSTWYRQLAFVGTSNTPVEPGIGGLGRLLATRIVLEIIVLFGFRAHFQISQRGFKTKRYVVKRVLNPVLVSTEVQRSANFEFVLRRSINRKFRRLS
jgi:hypothetical protein